MDLDPNCIIPIYCSFYFLSPFIEFSKTKIPCSSIEYQIRTENEYHYIPPNTGILYCECLCVVIRFYVFFFHCLLCTYLANDWTYLIVMSWTEYAYICMFNVLCDNHYVQWVYLNFLFDWLYYNVDKTNIYRFSNQHDHTVLSLISFERKNAIKYVYSYLYTCVHDEHLLTETGLFDSLKMMIENFMHCGLSLRFIDLPCILPVLVNAIVFTWK